jgi:hypothetical protein
LRLYVIGKRWLFLAGVLFTIGSGGDRRLGFLDILRGPHEVESFLVAHFLDRHRDRVLALELALEELFRERILDEVLDGTTERSGTVVEVGTRS